MTTIAPLPTPPDANDSVSDFNSKAFAFWGAMPAMRLQINTVSVEINDAAIAAAASAVLASSKATASDLSAQASASSAQSSAASAGAAAWNAATNYSTGVRVWSLLNQQLYRRIVPGITATDPSLDFTNWARVWVEPEMVTAESFYF
jgi:hypothetical protein